MVNLDSLGLAESEFWATPSDAELASVLTATAKTFQLPLSSVSFEENGISDAGAFRAQRIPSITIHSLDLRALETLHEGGDRLGSIHKDRYYRSYCLVQAYLAALDRSLNSPSAADSNDSR
jgi:hypothetical protein